ncbi:fatty acyl-CoA reductase wat-like [Phymastichus coffea]|uniref:fatty acyl-CoA reductase wat-like n=1 Tax=Phymastichus coffea TaxID=108790 RepID=UPI00273CDA54|nr:fatty acyl-CoA reductase wat-like [Phymastichus coffea]
MVEVLMESGGQEVALAETCSSRAGTPTECTAKLVTHSQTQKINDDENTTVAMTPIQEFYAGQSIFITGGTGFMGKLLIEKLLRSCPGIAFIYLLVRPKKGKDVHQRTEELIDDVLFLKLKEERPKFRYQIVAVAGDCSLPGLGLSAADRTILTREISIVFHVAATVRFDEKLQLAVAINVQSPGDIIKLCKDMTQLKACVHVSTAYANCVHNEIEEKFYDAPIDGNKLIALVEGIDEKLIDDITRPILGQWPNTYTFTKAVAEDVICKESGDLPIGIFRPAIVISTYMEPVRGWIDNMYGPTGVAAGAGGGLLRSLHCDGKLKANVVPGDLTINALIASAWDIANVGKNNKNTKEIPIYNYVSKDNPITWDELKDYSAIYGVEYPLTRAVWYYSFRNTKSKFVHTLYMYFLHLLPALLVDTVTLCLGKQPRMLSIYKKIMKFMDVLNYFTTKEWQFKNDNVNALADKLHNKDRSLFYMDMRDVDWDLYFQSYIKGIRTYLMKEPLDNLHAAKIRWRRMYWLHQATKALFAYGALRLSWFALKTVYYLVL